MQHFKNKYGKWALVAGAAEGLGAAFAEVLGGCGMNMILIDRDTTKLKATAERLQARFSVEVVTLSLDLSSMENIDVIIKNMERVACRLMVYNAAYGPVKDFLTNTPEELDYYIDLNARMPIHMVYRFLGIIPKGEKAGILLMSSLAGLWGTQLVVPYGATKAFDYNLAEGLHYELKERQIDVMACCAGATDTPNYRSTQPRKNLLGPTIMNPNHVAEQALKKLGKKAVYIPGFSNQFNYFLLTRILPRSFSAGLMNQVMYKMYRT